MSEPAFEAPVDDQGSDSGYNPNESTVEPQEYQAPWSKYLDGIPSSITPIVETKFKEWDADVTRRFQKVHSDYEPLKSYQPLYEAGYDPGQLQQLADAINNNPRQVYEALVANFGDEWGLGEADSEQGQEDNEELPEYDPKITELQSTVDVMADILLEQHRAEQTQQEDQTLDMYLDSLASKYGEFDERVVLGLMNAGLSGDDAVAAYQQSIQQALSAANRPAAPRILGSGGGVPTESADLSSPTARKQVIAQMLANAKENM